MFWYYLIKLHSQGVFVITTQQTKDPIKHVVLLMLENHSFDEMLGCFQEKYPYLEGVNPNNPPRFNVDSKGNKYHQLPKDSYSMKLDPLHDFEDVKEQMAEGNAGFIKNFLAHYKCKATQEECHNIMGYYRRGFLPALHALAEDFTICDHWFSSLPGPTWPNRLFALSGTSSGYVTMPDGIKDLDFVKTIDHQTQKTIFDRLSEKGKTWKIFFYDFPESLIFANQRKPDKLSHYNSIDEFFKDDTQKDESSFPDFVFIEPKYFGLDQNDDHPPHTIMKAEKLIGDVYNAIRSNDSLWNTTLLIVVFDEHGGFYDHVMPPPAVPPDNQLTEYTFDQLGLRVPAILVSPWVKRGVDTTIYDHTSLLKYLINKWDLGPLGERTAQANSIARAISSKKRPETDTLAHIRVPFSQLIQDDVKEVDPQTSSHQGAIHRLADYIENELNGEEPSVEAKAFTILTQIFHFWIEIKAWVGKMFYELGMKLAGQKIQDHTLRINKTEFIAKKLIEGAKTRNQ